MKTETWARIRIWAAVGWLALVGGLYWARARGERADVGASAPAAPTPQPARYYIASCGGANFTIRALRFVGPQEGRCFSFYPGLLSSVPDTVLCDCVVVTQKTEPAEAAKSAEPGK